MDLEALKLYQQTCRDWEYLQGLDHELLSRAHRLVEAKDRLDPLHLQEVPPRERRAAIESGLLARLAKEKEKAIVELLPRPVTIQGHLDIARQAIYKIGIDIGKSLYDIVTMRDPNEMQTRSRELSEQILLGVIDGTYPDYVRRLAEMARKLQSDDKVV